MAATKKASDVNSSKNVEANEVIHTTAQGKINQTKASLIVALTYIVFSMPLGYSAVFLPQIRDPAEPITMNLDEESWFASMYSVGLPIGSMLAGTVIEKFGRIPTLKYPMILTMTGWTLIALANSMLPLLIGRLLIGISCSLISSSSQVYVSEISDPKLRGSFVNLGYILFSIGIFLMSVLGALFHWRNIAWASILLPLITFILMHQIPESPTWLVYHNKSEKAYKVLLWLRGDARLAKRDLDDLCKRFEEDSNGVAPTFSSLLSDCTKKSALKPIILVICFMLCLQATGTYMIVFYSVDILSALGSTVDGITMSVITSIARLVATLAFCFIFYVAKRRPIYIISGISSGLCLTVAAFYLQFCVDQSHVMRDVYVTCALITTYIITNTGFLLARNVFAGEMIPARIRGPMISYVYMFLNITFFIWTFSIPYILYYWGASGLFVVFSSANFAAALLAYICLPETFKKTLGEIEDYFKESGWIYRGHSNVKKNATI